MSQLMFCKSCNRLYRQEDLKSDEHGNYWCPDIKCPGELFEVDELMGNALQLLWEKNYITSFCCSGHIYEEDPQGYIMFISTALSPTTSDGCPDGWTVRKYKYLNEYNRVVQTGVRYGYEITEEDKDKNNGIFENILLDKIKSLYEWIYKLPSNQYPSIEKIAREIKDGSDYIKYVDTNEDGSNITTTIDMNANLKYRSKPIIIK
jgi:hypothetical protein